MVTVTRGLLLLGALFTALGASAREPTPDGVSAEDDARARDLFDEGRRLYRDGRYLEAAAAWEAGYAFSPRPLFLANIGTAYERLGEVDRAIDYLARYVDFAPQTELPALEARIAALEALRDAPDHRPDGDGPPPELPPPETPAARPRLTAPSLALGGVAAAGLGVGVGFGASAVAARRAAEVRCGEVAGALYCASDAAPVLRKNRAHAVVADVGFGVAGAAALSGLLVVLLDDRGWRAVPSLHPGGAGLVVTGRLR